MRTSAVVVPTTVPSTRGGWWHAYVCPVHGVELDPADGGAGFGCRHGCVLTGEPYASAWVALDHQRTARLIRLLAARSGPDGTATDADVGANADAAIDLIAAYAGVYASLGTGGHEGAAGWMVPGRLFHQALSESIWATALADAVWTLTERVDTDRSDRLAAAAVPLLTSLHDTAAAARASTDLRSNYVAWFDAAGALCAGALTRLGAPPPDAGWVDGPTGIHAHLRAAVLPDGWQWEGSSYYHVFVLLAALYALRGTDPALLPRDVAVRLRGMVRVLDELTGPDGVLPALHDSPYRRNPGAEDLRTEHEITEVCEVAEVVGLSRRLLGDDVLGPLGGWCADVLAGRSESALLNAPEHWFTGAPLSAATHAAEASPDTAGAVFDQAGYAVLRPADGDWRAVIDFGPHGGSHGHLDKLALYVTGSGAAWQPDPGITPYASPLRDGVYRTTRAHPTFSVDGADQDECTGALMHAAADGRSLVVAADDAYPGVRARRHLQILDRRTLLDVLVLDADVERTFAVHLRPAVPVTVRADGAAGRIDWSGATALVTRHACSLPARLAPVPGWSAADDPTRPQVWIDWTATAAAAVFATVWSIDATADDDVHVDAGPDHVEVHLPGQPSVIRPLTLGDLL